MNKVNYKCLLISSFNTSNFAGCMDNDPEQPHMETIQAPYGQVVPVLMQSNQQVWETDPEFVVVWTQPGDVIRSFSTLRHKCHISETELIEEVDAFASAVTRVSDCVKAAFIPTWAIAPYDRGLGMLDMETGLGVSNVLMQMNLRLAEKLKGHPSCIVLNTQRWISLAGKKAFDPKLWYMAKIPFSIEVFSEATKDIKAAIRGLTGQARKLILLDLDNTLWGGLVGEVGWEKIRLGGHDHVGEAYADFQHTLKSLTHRGILLGIVSKNEESVGLEAINKHQEMILKLDDFAGWRINWQDKAQNIAELVSDLNLGLDSVVFMDDSPVERARVKDALPEVIVPDMPEDNTLYKSVLLNLNCFDIPSISQEDRTRTVTYVSERKRKAAKATVQSLDEWLKTLQMKVRVDVLNRANLSRTAQLFNKTNQMNLSTRRMAEWEIMDWSKPPNRSMWVFFVSDKFGDSGLTGIASLEIKESIGTIVDFILSCRVMGRRVEEAMLHTIVSYAKSRELREVQAEYVATPKNRPCRRFFDESGFESVADDIFVWNTEKPYKKPEHITLI